MPMNSIPLVQLGPQLPSLSCQYHSTAAAALLARRRASPPPVASPHPLEVPTTPVIGAVVSGVPVVMTTTTEPDRDPRPEPQPPRMLRSSAKRSRTNAAAAAVAESRLVEPSGAAVGGADSDGVAAVKYPLTPPHGSPVAAAVMAALTPTTDARPSLRRRRQQRASAATTAAEVSITSQQQQQQQQQLQPTATVLRCVADLEAAVSYLRGRDPKLVPLVNAHGLPHSLLACTTAAATASAARPITADAALAAVGAAASASETATATVVVTPTVGGSSTGTDGECPWSGSRDSAAGGGGGGGEGSSNSRRSVFAALARSIVYQQLATGAAAAIWGRVLAVCQDPSGGGDDSLTPAQVLAAPSEQLRGAGLSGRKLEYLLGLAKAFATRVDWDERLSGSCDLEQLVSELTPLRGVGTWTVHMLAMFHLGLADVLPYGDLGVRRGLQVLHGLPELPAPGQVDALTEVWRPYRSVGCWYMWRIPPPPRTATKAGKKAATMCEGGYDSGDGGVRNGPSAHRAKKANVTKAVPKRKRAAKEVD